MKNVTRFITNRSSKGVAAFILCVSTLLTLSVPAMATESPTTTSAGEFNTTIIQAAPAQNVQPQTTAATDESKSKTLPMILIGAGLLIGAAAAVMMYKDSKKKQSPFNSQDGYASSGFSDQLDPAYANLQYAMANQAQNTGQNFINQPPMTGQYMAVNQPPQQSPNIYQGQGFDPQAQNTGQFQNPQNSQQVPVYGNQQDPYGQNQAPQGYNNTQQVPTSAPPATGQVQYVQNSQQVPVYGNQQDPYGQNQAPQGYNNTQQVPMNMPNTGNVQIPNPSRSDNPVVLPGPIPGMVQTNPNVSGEHYLIDNFKDLTD